MPNIKRCPLLGVAIYMDCLECEEKPCKHIREGKCKGGKKKGK